MSKHFACSHLGPFGAHPIISVLMSLSMLFLLMEPKLELISFSGVFLGPYKRPIVSHCLRTRVTRQ